MSHSLQDHKEVGAEAEVEVEVDDDFDGDDEAAAMAAAMGFSSFGMKESDRPSKKRRFNNAVVDADAGTGANSTPLPPRVAKTENTDQNPDEIDLGDSDEDNQNGNGSRDQPPTVASAYPLPARPSTQPLAPPGVANYDLPLIPPPGIDGPSFQAGGGGGRGGHGPNSRGGRGGGNSFNPEWYIDYYDPSFNENPWERLEQAKGLSPVGSWLPGRSPGAKSAPGISS